MHVTWMTSINPDSCLFPYIKQKKKRKKERKKERKKFPGGPMIKNPLVNARDTGWIPGLGRSHTLWSN